MIEENHVRRALPDIQKLSALRERLLTWYADAGRSFRWRRSSASSYEVVIAELLLQRTRAETVERFLDAFLVDFPSWKQLASADLHDLEAVLRPIGLWRRRARVLSDLAKLMGEQGGQFPNDREALEALPGIGQYVASAVLLFCFGASEPLLDTNMSRVLERVFGHRELADIRYDPWLQALARNVVNDPKSMEINWAILDLAAMVCKPRIPICDKCPLFDICLYNQKHKKP